MEHERNFRRGRVPKNTMSGSRFVLATPKMNQRLLYTRIFKQLTPDSWEPILLKDSLTGWHRPASVFTPVSTLDLELLYHIKPLDHTNEEDLFIELL